MPITLDQVASLSVGDSEVAAIDYKDILDSGELLTGTPTVVEVTTTDLTLSNKVVNTVALTIDGRTCAIGKAVQFKVSGQLAAQGLYRVRVTVSTDATVARTFVRDVIFTAE